ncbi:MAG: hypothetical protein US30_C0012G0006 [Candidatus Moranbacteria bacterium GW2011_GWF2_36_839]|nr:MAG: hypothetical protein US27_C0015G0021 [Candidatus Moranbacteria bacterium GW2011_GWF1_36_78]KKQ16696.1 MAG: hypothetical protein US30_C0012G0006 [Candidatus Moranbacteria bacterium GW2011_GWF2_36_839]HAT74209.1 hypothetical protein [Candidatus Moranbacteria bacterium]HBY11423.1 hypothetical protein [Candidatus Moranbacteria bacterium]
MNILIPAIIISLAILGLFFFITYRKVFIDLISTAFTLIFGAIEKTWRFITGKAPAVGATIGTAGTSVGRATLTVASTAWRIIIIFLIVAIVLGLITIISIASLYALVAKLILWFGILTGNASPASILIYLLVMWGVFEMLPNYWIFKPLKWLSKKNGFVPLAVIAVVIYIAITGSSTLLWQKFGNVSPKLQGSITRSVNNHVQGITNSLDKKSIHSEAEQGIWGLVLEGGATYNQAGQVVETDGLKANTRVKACELKGKPATEGAEGLICVMLPNKYGDFVDGNRRWVPSRKISWENQPEKERKIDTSNASGEEKKVVLEISISESEFPQSMEVPISGSQAPQSIKILPPGEYEVNFNPVAAAAGATYRVILPNNGRETREIKNNLISVKGGEEVFAIWTAIPSVAKIRPK